MMDVLKRYEKAKRIERDRVIKEMLESTRSPETVMGISEILSDRLAQEERLDTLKAAKDIVMYLTTPQIIKL